MGRAFAAAALAAWIGAGALARAARADPEGPGTLEVCELLRADRAKATPRRCLSCHDGSVSSKAIAAAHEPGRGLGHPVDVDYLATWSREPSRFAGTLPAEVPLVDGKVACTSCHDGASSRADRVVVLRDGGNLCLACHRL